MCLEGRTLPMTFCRSRTFACFEAEDPEWSLRMLGPIFFESRLIFCTIVGAVATIFSSRKLLSPAQRLTLKKRSTPPACCTD